MKRHRSPAAAAGAVARRVVLYGVVLIMVIYSIFPFYWMIVSSFKDRQEIFAAKPTYYPHRFTVNNYWNLFTKTNALNWFRNSVVVTTCSVVLATAVAATGAYALTRFRMRGRTVIGNLVLFVYMFPAIMIGIPLFFIMHRLGLLDSHFGLVVAYVAQVLPYTLWLLRAFFQAIPIGIEEAARMDGASRLQTIIRVVFPLALPGIVATSVFSAMVCWNEYVYAFLFLAAEWKKTIPTGLRHFTTSHGVLWEYIFSLSVLAAIPLVIFFLSLQKRLIETMSGGVKG
jgi:ABC-type glycerol-3-phosphate transport system permease component